MIEPLKSSTLLKQIEKFITGIYKSRKEKLPFHTLARVKKHLHVIDKLLKNYSLSSHEKFVLQASAWFQGIGFLVGDKNYIETSAGTAEHFLNALRVPKATITEVRKAILAAQVPQRARDVVQNILCDSVLFYLGESDFKRQHKKLRKEEELLQGYKIDKTLWLQQSIALLSTHNFQTEFVQQRLKQSKQDNLQNLMKANRSFPIRIPLNKFIIA